MIWLGDSNPFKDKESVDVKIFEYDDKIAFTTKFRGYKILVTITGYFIFVCDKKNVAHKLLNELMALMYLIVRRTPVMVVREQDIGSLRINLKKMEIITSKKPTTDRIASWIESRFGQLDPIDFNDYGKIQFIDKDTLKDFIDTADSYPKGYEKLLQLLLEAYTFYQEGDLIAGYLLGWIVIEGIVTRKWKDYLEKEFTVDDISDKKKESMWKGIDWTISIKIRSLQTTKQINHKLVNLLLKFNSNRNDLVHKYLWKNINITNEKAYVLIRIARLLTLKYIKNEDWINLSKNNEEIITEILEKWDAKLEDVIMNWQ